MSQSTLRVATWNIGGAHTVNSKEVFDYDKEDIDYFVTALKQLDLDIIALQESHANDHDVLARRLAAALDMPFVFNSQTSASHINENYQLSNAIISKFPIEAEESFLLPDPAFELYFTDGRKAVYHPRRLQVSYINGVCFANTHLQPLHLFGHSYHEGEGKFLAEQIQEVFFARLKRPLIFGADLNDQQAAKAYQSLFKSLKLQDALGPAATDNKGKKVDYLLYSAEFGLEDSGLIKTDQSDHYLGWADFRLLKS